MRVCYNIFMDIPYTEPTSPPQLPVEQETAADKQAASKQRTILIVAIIFLILILALVVWAVIALLRADPNTTAQIRDVFLIFLALESLLLGVAMIVLIIQLASLINLLQNEVRPILHATSDTVNNLRGTVEFLGENVVDPVIKLNGYLAGMQRVLELLRIKQK